MWKNLSIKSQLILILLIYRILNINFSLEIIKI
jgi:hypothetical protein